MPSTTSSTARSRGWRDSWPPTQVYLQTPVKAEGEQQDPTHLQVPSSSSIPAAAAAASSNDDSQLSMFLSPDLPSEEDDSEGEEYDDHYDQDWDRSILDVCDNDNDYMDFEFDAGIEDDTRPSWSSSSPPIRSVSPSQLAAFGSSLDRFSLSLSSSPRRSNLELTGIEHVDMDQYEEDEGDEEDFDDEDEDDDDFFDYDDEDDEDDYIRDIHQPFSQRFAAQLNINKPQSYSSPYRQPSSYSSYSSFYSPPSSSSNTPYRHQYSPRHSSPLRRSWSSEHLNSSSPPTHRRRPGLSRNGTYPCDGYSSLYSAQRRDPLVLRRLSSSQSWQSWQQRPMFSIREEDENEDSTVAAAAKTTVVNAKPALASCATGSKSNGLRKQVRFALPAEEI